ncbi:MAG TPA: murein biosynthesis integral membrane protein MurJ, partial [Thermoanaerobaculia bacterium]|nr:murein biosynthesis integral membrane protein MurJ [Thermoanaerobaculia bacterium]
TAFRIPNTFRAIVGEGGLPGAFVPIAKRVERESPGNEGVYAGRVLSLLTLVLAVLVALGLVFSPALVDLFARGFRKTPGKFELTVLLTRLMFPYVLLVSSASLLEAFLNAKGRFQLSAATPIALNLSIVAAAWALTPAGVPVPYGLAAGVLAGGLLQFLMQWPAARGLGFRFGGSPFRDPDVRRTALQIAPRLYGYGVGQLNFLVSSRTLSELGDAYYTYNFCAFRIVDFVLGGFVVSVTRAILPSLSEQALEEDRGEYRGTVAFGLRLAGLVTIPATVGLLLLAAPVVDLVFRRGRFDAHDVKQTALAVVFFSLGLYAAAGVKILTQAFYALHDTRTPVLVATFDLLAFWVLCVWLAAPLKHAGVALATSAGFWINFVLLFILLRKRLGRIGGKELLVSSARLVLASLAMGALLLAGGERLLPYDAAWSFPLRAAWLLGAVALGGSAFWGAALAVRAPEVAEVLGVFRRRRAA